MSTHILFGTTDREFFSLPRKPGISQLKWLESMDYRYFTLSSKDQIFYIPTPEGGQLISNSTLPSPKEAASILSKLETHWQDPNGVFIENGVYKYGPGVFSTLDQLTPAKIVSTRGKSYELEMDS